jgi:hypothetical protein
MEQVVLPGRWHGAGRRRRRGMGADSCDFRVGECAQINWTGGDPKSWISVSFIEQEPGAYGGYQSVPYAFQTHTSNGTMTIPDPIPPMEVNNQYLCMNEAGPVTIAIEVDPDPSEIAPFSASGISLGGQATWKYVHTFQASF